MKRVTAFVGSARRGHTYQAVCQFLAGLEKSGDVECEILRLADYRLESCRGCCSCFNNGEATCPLKDDRDFLIRKIEASDGVVFASPNYSFQVSGLMKTFLDRLGFLFHRPRFHGKVFTGLVTQGIYGGRKVAKYLDFVGGGLGFNTVRSSCLKTLDPMTDEARAQFDRSIAAQAERYRAELAKGAFPKPGWIKLLLFRLSRTSMSLMLDGASCDWRYYTERGWFDSDYYYPTRLGLLKSMAGRLFDAAAGGLARKRRQA
jgi:multimeric flavodoxin WrbA